MKLAFSYEGLSECGKDRFRTLEKLIHTGFSPTTEFWQGFSVELASRYDLSRVGEVILGGDGASWVKGGGKLFRVDRYQLDRFHLSRALKRALGARAFAAFDQHICFVGHGDTPKVFELASLPDGTPEEEATVRSLLADSDES